MSLRARGVPAVAVPTFRLKPVISHRVRTHGQVLHSKPNSQRKVTTSATGSASVGLIWSAAAASLALESRTVLGKRVTSPLLSFFFGWMLRSMKVLPPMHPVYLGGIRPVGASHFLATGSGIESCPQANHLFCAAITSSLWSEGVAAAFVHVGLDLWNLCELW